MTVQYLYTPHFSRKKSLQFIDFLPNFASSINIKRRNHVNNSFERRQQDIL